MCEAESGQKLTFASLTMTKLLTLDLRSSIPCPQASPVMTASLQSTHLNESQTELGRWQTTRVELKDDDECPGLSDFMVTVPFRIASSRFIEVLRRLQAQCEYLPLVATYRERSFEGEFFALNALHVVRNAIDIERSKIGRHYPDLAMARGVERLVLNETALRDEPLSYLREISAFAVNEPLADAIERASLVGIRLLPPDQFTS